VHVPQLTKPPQPSGIVPQLRPAGHDVSGWQWPHRPETPPPPQVSGAVQVPQSINPPQPFGAVPQFWPAGHAVPGVQLPRQSQPNAAAQLAIVSACCTP